MRNLLKGFLCLVVTILFLFNINITPIIIYANDEAPTVKVAMSEDESIIVERILYTALKRIGYQMTTNTAGMRTMVNAVNNGDSAIVPAQAIGLDEEYTNLIRIPVPISYVEINAYARTKDAFEFSSWDDLTGLRLSYCRKNVFVSNNVYRANASETTELTEYEELWEALLNNETDVAVIPNLTGFVRVVPSGVSMVGVVQRQERFTYVNKDYEELVPLLTEAYQNMTDDGTIEKIRDSSQTSSEKVILHISSYGSQVEWEKGEIEAIRSNFEFGPSLKYHNLFLSARHVANSSDMHTVIANTIRTHFIERNPDVIVVTDNDALEFTLNNYYMLFPKVPIVFCGVNDFDASILHGFEEYVTGVTETISATETVEQMLKMYPDTKRIYVLSDNTGSGSVWLNALKKQLDNDNFNVDIEFSQNKLFSEILTEIGNFGTDTLVLLGTYYSDGGDSFYSEREVQEQVSAASPMPVFCLANSFNGFGTLGGLVSVNTAQGNALAEILDDVLGGTPPSQIPIVTETSSLNRWQFDYNVMQKFGINQSSLPAGYTEINSDIPIWETNPLEFRIAFFGCVVFIMVIIGLIVFLRLLRNKNLYLTELQSHLHSAEELLEKDNDMRKMIESLPVSVLIVDTATCKPEYGNHVFLSVNGFETLEQAESIDMSVMVEKANEALHNSIPSFQFGSLANPQSDICQEITVERMVYRNKNCFLLISEDITAHVKEKELLAKAAEKEREASHAKSNFLSNMSHEIRTPLTAITGMTLIGKTSANLEKKDYAFKKIEEASSHLLSVINDILDMSKIEANKFTLSIVEYNFEYVMQKIANVFSFRIDEKRLSFSVFLDKRIPETLIGDDHRLIQIINNLISNAIKFTPENGAIRLDARLVDEMDDVCTLQFDVTDTGIGINKERQSEIFNSFEQAENDTTRQYGGTGLGLSISKHITELLGGKIWVESELGKGSKFSFTIKAKRGSAISNKPIKTGLDKNNIKTLVIDDDSDIRLYFTDIAESIGVKCDTASSGKEALSLISKNNYDVFFVDWNMPEMNGIELTRKMRPLTSDNAVIIMISSFEWSVIEDDAKNAGVNKFLPKPLFPSAVIDCIYDAIGYKSISDASGVPVEIISYSGKRVLLAEDIDINREIVLALFEPTDITFDCAENGEEALQMFKANPDAYDMILMDLQMPKMGGLEATKRIRELGFAKAESIPILAMTANVFKEDIEQCLNSGMNDHVSKPLDFEEAFGKMKKWLK